MTPRTESAASDTNAVILTISITVILAALVLVLALQYASFGFVHNVPDDIRISGIQYTMASDGVNFIGLVVVSNTGNENLRNRYLNVKTIVNGLAQDCRIPTLNNQLFCSSDHTGVARLHGLGTHGNQNSPLAVWPANSDIAIEYKKGKMRPEDTVTLEFFDTNTGQLISRDTWPHTEKRDVMWFYEHFL